MSFLFIVKSLQKDKHKSPKFKFHIFKYTPLKTILSTSLLLTVISVMLIFGTNGNSMFTSFGTQTKKGNNFYEMLQLDYFTNDPIDESYETFTRENAKIINVNDQILDKKYGVRVYGIDSDNSLKLLIDNNIENNLLLEQGTIISEYVHFNLGVEIGDEIILSIDDEELIYTVVGISNELIENNLFILKTDLNNIYSLDNTYYNGVYAADEFYESNKIIRRVNYETGLEDILSTLRASSIIVNFILTLSIGLSLFVFALVIMNYLSDNRLNISILMSSKLLAGFVNKCCKSSS